MLSELQVNRVYLACGSTDMRKSNDGLAVLVKEGFDLEPFTPALFAFCALLPPAGAGPVPVAAG